MIKNVVWKVDYSFKVTIILIILPDICSFDANIITINNLIELFV